MVCRPEPGGSARPQNRFWNAWVIKMKMWLCRCCWDGGLPRSTGLMRSTPGCSSRTETCRCASFFWGFFCVIYLSHVGLHGIFWAFKSTWPMRGMPGCSSRTETCRCAFFLGIIFCF